MTLKNLAKVYSAELEGVNAKLIEVEVDINVGLHSFTIVGLADRALNEARERVNSALKNIGARPPNRENRRITINLAPADVKKAGSQYDLAIALGYLHATKQIASFDTSDKVFVGELALDGRLRPVNGALSIAEMARHKKFRYLFLPRENANEARAIEGVEVIALDRLAEAKDFLEGRAVPQHAAVPTVAPNDRTNGDAVTHVPDLSEIVGQENAKRALTIAASGGHNILLSGPPGVGKSMLAHAIVGILPDLTKSEAIEVTKIWSAAGLSPGFLLRNRPFRAPHQTASHIALMGGGPDPKPGEISLAHRGVLFLDELPEFPRGVLASLREPLESGAMHIGRARRSILFPARCMLIAAMNPCPCGYYGDPERECTCGAYEVIRYQKKISGPFMDRIDLQIKIGRIKVAELGKKIGEAVHSSSSSAVKRKVERAQAIQRARFADENISLNAEMSSREARAVAHLEPGAERFLEMIDGRRLSPRGYYRILKVARTIADLDEKEAVSAEHLAEAFSYRLTDWFN